MNEPLLQVKNLCTSFNVDSGEVRAVNGISFNLEKGRVLGIVGESGSGKSVTAYYCSTARTSSSIPSSRCVNSGASGSRSSSRTP